MKKFIAVITAFCLIVPTAFAKPFWYPHNTHPPDPKTADIPEKSNIKWVEFDIPSDILARAADIDIKSHETENHQISWVNILARLAVKCGGNFSKLKKKECDKFFNNIGEQDLILDTKIYKYYQTAYSAVLSGFLGEFEEQDESGVWLRKYGLKAYSPIAAGFDFTHYDDFGQGRTFGYKRKHLGHDLLGLTGTPIIATESGTVEELGWNKYGGWRIGIRSFDGKRYYYYAHLRQNRPFAENLAKGDVVMAGDVIGYMGRTGYSTQENKNNIQETHLHWGLQLVFDEAQKDGVNQIWLDLYELTKFLQRRKSQTNRNPETKEFTRKIQYRETIPENRYIPPSVALGTNNECVKIPCIMYHSVVTDNRRRNTYTITAEDIKKDFQFLRQNNYTAVSVKDILDYVNNGFPLPEKPILLTFDDGQYNNMTIVTPLLQEHNLRAVCFVVGDFCDRAVKEDMQKDNYSYLKPCDLKTMTDTGLWEIGSHTYSCHKNDYRGVAKRSGESDAEYGQRLYDDFLRMNDKILEATKKKPLGFSYPFGVMSKIAEDAAFNTGSEITLTSNNGAAIFRAGDKNCLHKVKRLLRTDKKTLEKLLV